MYLEDQVIEEVRSRNDIVDVIGSYVNLKKKGNSYSCCCPFHQEKTPSFHVSREKQMYHCFGCGVGGNVVTFVMEYENYSFMEAMKYLAERAGVDLPERTLTDQEKQKMNEKETMKEMNRISAAYFHYLLKGPHGEKALRYLKNRGLSDEIILKFGLGYADMYRDDLYRYLKSKGYTDPQIKDAALAIFDEKKGVFDRFWDRVMFPIMDINNRVIGFGGRVMGDGEPKYLNSNDTVVFDKSKNLYGLNIARKSKKRGIILCEGYMDVISMHQAGYDNAVASLGTAFTIGQASLLKRYTDEIYLAYDCDGAGVKAAIRAIGILREFGTFTVRRIDLRPYKDPDELIQNCGVEEFEKRVKNAISAIMYEIQVLSEEYDQSDPETRTKFHHKAAQKLSLIDDPLERVNYIEAVSREYQIDKEALKLLVNKYGTELYREKVVMDEPRKQRENVEDKKVENQNAPMKLLITWLVNEPELFAVVRRYLTADDFYEGIYHQVALMLFEQYEKEGKVTPAKIVNQYTDVDEQKKVAQLFQTEFSMKVKADDRSRALTDLVKKVKMNRIQWELSTVADMSRWQALFVEKAETEKIQIEI